MVSILLDMLFEPARMRPPFALPLLPYGLFYDAIRPGEEG